MCRKVSTIHSSESDKALDGHWTVGGRTANERWAEVYAPSIKERSKNDQRTIKDSSGNEWLAIDGFTEKKRLAMHGFAEKRGDLKSSAKIIHFFEICKSFAKKM